MQNKAKMTWIEMLRVVSAFGILFYHTGRRYTGYTFTPMPTGIMANWQTLNAVLTSKFGDGLNGLAGFISVFSFEFLDVFILLTGITVVLSSRGQEDYLGYVKRRWLRVLWPFWLAVLVTLILTVYHHYFYGGYIAPSWNWFVAFTFPLAYDYHGLLIQHISGPWWFVPFMLALILISPFMLKKLETWGVSNFLMFFGALTLVYRFLAIYGFNATVNYSASFSRIDSAPFLLFPAKIFLVAIGMALGKLIKEDGFTTNKATLFFGAIFLYTIGFMSQFYFLGWVFAEFFYAPAIVMFFYATFSQIEQRYITGLITKLGALSYSFFLMHDFFVNKLLKTGGASISSFWQTVTLAAILSLLTATLIEKLIPTFSKAFSVSWAFIDRKLVL